MAKNDITPATEAKNRLHEQKPGRGYRFQSYEPQVQEFMFVTREVNFLNHGQLRHWVYVYPEKLTKLAQLDGF